MKFDYEYFVDLLVDNKNFEEYIARGDDNQGSDNIHCISRDVTVSVFTDKRLKKSATLFTYLIPITSLVFSYDGITIYDTISTYPSRIYYDDIVDVKSSNDSNLVIWLSNGFKLVFEIY